MKPFYRSKTFWLNVLIIIVALIETVHDLEIIQATHFIILMAFLNIIVRLYFTNVTPIK